MNLQNIINDKEDVYVGRGVENDKISHVEQTIGILFSEDYKEYLQTVGVFMGAGHELTGLGCIDRLNVGIVTKHLHEVHLDIPQDWYVIEDLYMDGTVVWQDRKGIIYYNKHKIFTSIYEYIQDFLK